MADEAVPLASVLGESYVGGRVLTGVVEPGAEITDLDLEQCRIEAAVLELSVWRRCSLEGCTLVGVNLSRARIVDVRFSDCALLDSKAQAVNWSGVRAGGLATRSITFERCRLDYGSFAGADIRGMRFVECSLVDADFGGADAREVEFVDCDLSGARFVGADLRGALVVGATGLGLDVRDTRAKGLRVDPGGALALVEALGLRVVEDVTPPAGGATGWDDAV
ncbi:MAG: pentapeptide repeat-containing protein [Dermatophilaceae bacterium]